MTSDYGPGTYGDRVATSYDDLYGHMDPTSAVERLASLAGAGRALELGIGTGRIALPLAARGVEVHGIDASEAMVAQLRAKPGGEDVPVAMGDFADVAIDGEFDLIFVAFNTFFALLTQEDQLRCFQNVANHLTADGVFVVRGFVPDLARFDRGQRVSTSRVEVDMTMLEVTQHDAATQRVTSQHIRIDQNSVQLYPVQLRYAWPSELDLMARLAGLHLDSRTADWAGTPFTSDSPGHVSVYARQ